MIGYNFVELFLAQTVRLSSYGKKSSNRRVACKGKDY